MGDRVLVIDDDHHLLSALRRQLGERFDVTPAQGGAEAIETVMAAMREKSPFAVALSDMRMPGMDGIETLKRIRDLAPDTVRMMLTGNADQQTATDAINQGNIFRFFSKPYPVDQLGDGIQAGIDQYRLITAERELLEKTLTGSIRMLADLISINDPVGQGLAARLEEWIRLLTVEFNMPQRWQLEIAATLVPLVEVALPPELLAKKRQGETLNQAERSLFEHAPETARNLIANIPRLGGVAEILYLQNRGYDGSGFPADGPKGADIPLDARLLKILKDLAGAANGGPLTKAAFDVLDRRRAQYDPVLLAKVGACLRKTVTTAPPAVAEVPVASLRAGQVLDADLRLTNGRVILPANTQLSEAQILRLCGLRKMFWFAEPARVRL